MNQTIFQRERLSVNIFVAYPSFNAIPTPGAVVALLSPKLQIIHRASVHWGSFQYVSLSIFWTPQLIKIEANL